MPRNSITSNKFQRQWSPELRTLPSRLKNEDAVAHAHNICRFIKSAMTGARVWPISRSSNYTAQMKLPHKSPFPVSARSGGKLQGREPSWRGAGGLHLLLWRQWGVWHLKSRPPPDKRREGGYPVDFIMGQGRSLFVILAHFKKFGGELCHKVDRK